MKKLIRMKIVLINVSAVLILIFFKINEVEAASCAMQISNEGLPVAKIEVTGKGYPPKKEIPVAQKRLLAKRAATIDAYRIMTGMLKGLSVYVVNGSGYIQTSGFVRGASVKGERYYTDGKVEVDLELPVTLVQKKTDNKTNWDNIIAGISKKGYPVYYPENPSKAVSEEEWSELMQNRK